MPRQERQKKEVCHFNIKNENHKPVNIPHMERQSMSEDKDAEKKKAEREEMIEEAHQLELKDGYEQDEEYEESED